VDLQSIPEADTSELCYEIARAVHSELKASGFRGIAEPRPEVYRADHYRCLQGFLRTAEGVLDHERVVLMIDEFDLLIRKVKTGEIRISIFDFIRSLVQHSRRLAFVFAGTREYERMRVLLSTTKSQRITYLEKPDARELIEAPVREYIDYDELALQKIVRLTGGHPYFIQCFCDLLFTRASGGDRHRLSVDDVDAVIPGVFEQTDSVLRELCRLSDQQLQVLAVLADITDEQLPYVALEDVVRGVTKHGFSVDSPVEALDWLIQEDLAQMSNGRYGLRMPLLGEWSGHRRLLRSLKGE
jgi:hypothetical protein